MREKAFTMVEILVVVLIAGMLIATLMRILSTTFSESKKGFDTLTMVQENAKLIASLKQDMRTLIMAGPDDIPPPDLSPFVLAQNDNTDSFEFFRVWNIHESGRPLAVKISYQRDNTPAGMPFGISRTTGSGGGAEPPKQFVSKMLTRFRVELLNNTGGVINSQSNRKDVKKVRLTLESKGSELLATTISIYSPYILPFGSLSPNELWVHNYLCADFQPGAAVRICEGGIIQNVSLTPLGTPLVLNGETPIVSP
ncbi:MAG: type II secretion system protein [Candidatus Riflebacteria bacterium]|nr:type II secretion system protein [Candidatus Riflebacteria bacterium]